MSNKKVAVRRGAGERFDGDLRRALIDEAIPLIAEVGAEQVSLREVARRTGVSHAAPAHHFGDKTGLLTAIAIEGYTALTESLTGSPAGHDTSALDRLLWLGTGYIEFAHTHPAHFDVMFRPRLVDTADAGYVTASNAAFEVLRSQVEQCQHAGWRSDADNRALTTSLWALVHGLAVLRATGSLARRHPDVTSAELLGIIGILA